MKLAPLCCLLLAAAAAAEAGTPAPHTTAQLGMTGVQVPLDPSGDMAPGLRRLASANDLIRGPDPFHGRPATRGPGCAGCRRWARKLLGVDSVQAAEW